MVTSRSNGNDENSVLHSYFQEVGRYKLLTYEQELEYSRRIELGDIEALNCLVNANLRLVVKIAKTYTRTNVSLIDIIQDGNIGLIKAAKKYDYRKKVRFCTYASWWIKQSIMSALSKSRTVFKKHGTADEEQNFVTQFSGTEIAVDITNTYELLPDTSNSGPDEALIRKSVMEDTHRLLDMLLERERKILTYRFALDDGGETTTFRAIGERMSLSAEAVRQITNRALKKLRCKTDPVRKYFYMQGVSGKSS